MHQNFLASMSHYQILSRHDVGTNGRKPIMTAKLNPFAAAPGLMNDWHRTSLAISSSLDPGLSELVKIRASQINGRANCLNMHTVYARENGETEQRIYLLSAWREAPCYSDRERAALGWDDEPPNFLPGHSDAGHRTHKTALIVSRNERRMARLSAFACALGSFTASLPRHLAPPFGVSYQCI
jgi:AhpD family alkylhydroperoxidase